MNTTLSSFKVFVSYSHKDEELRAELETHLAPLIREGLLNIWHDRKITPGQSWEKAIEDSVESADILILLVSPDFIASDYCYGVELQRGIQRHRREDAVVVPVVIRPVDWTHTPISGIQALPKNAIPITSWNNRDEAWLNVIEGIRATCIHLQQSNRDGPRAARKAEAIPFQPLLGSVIEKMELMLAADSPSLVGISTGLADLDALTQGFEAGEVVVVSSSPQIDRIGILMKIVLHVACQLRLPTLFVSASHEEDYLASRALSGIGRISFQKLRTALLSDDDWDRLTVALGMLHEAPITVLPFGEHGISDLTECIDDVASKYGALPLIVIDSLEHIAQDKSMALRALRKYALKNKRLIVVGTGLERDPGHRVDKRPVLEDLGEWARVCEDIDCLLLIYNDQLYRPDTADVGIAELIVAKARSGVRGTVRLGYSFETLSYENHRETSSARTRPSI